MALQCPHCRVTFQSHASYEEIGVDVHGTWVAESRICPSCSRLIANLVVATPKRRSSDGVIFTLDDVKRRVQVWPKGSNRPACPAEVSASSKDIAEDYTEACVVLHDSPKASAALSRRCLQHILRAVARVKHGNLADEISEAVSRGDLPSHISQSLDAVRVIGNFAAHPQKSQKTGEILPVEPGEAEWNLDVLEALFDFYLVQPEVMKKKKAALNAKLAEAGKKPLP